jgi:hypothetical protein
LAEVAHDGFHFGDDVQDLLLKFSGLEAFFLWALVVVELDDDQFLLFVKLVLLLNADPGELQLELEQPEGSEADVFLGVGIDLAECTFEAFLVLLDAVLALLAGADASPLQIPAHHPVFPLPYLEHVQHLQQIVGQLQQPS